MIVVAVLLEPNLVIPPAQCVSIKNQQVMIIKGLSEDIKDRERRDSLLLPQNFYSYKLIPKSQYPK